MSMMMLRGNTAALPFTRTPARLVLSGIFLLAAPIAAGAAEETQRLEQHYEGVLGTSLDLTLYGADRERLQRAGDAALAEIARLEGLLSTWRDDSELMQLNAARSASGLSPELLEVVRHCEAWKETSGGAFSCRLGGVTALWDEAERRGELPVVSDMLPTARTAGQSPILIDVAAGRIELGDAIELEPSGLAKGYIIDRAMAVLRRELPDSPALKLDIGGDAWYWGAPPGEDGWEVQVADPQAIADNTNFISTLSLSAMAVATSGHTSRGREIAGRRFSHLLDTRRGWPVDDGLYAVVIAPDAVTADAVATTLAVMNLDRALELVNSLDKVEALLVDSQGLQHFSLHWQDYLGGELRRQAGADIEVSLSYTIPDLRHSDYERPYIAIWVSDSEGRPIRNLMLHGGDQQWARTNSVWWSRVGRRSGLEAGHVTRPTRGPGEYQLSWDGTNDDGVVMPPGDYRLYFEASREHGGHDYLYIDFKLEEGSQRIAKEGSGEVGPALLTVDMQLPD